MRELEAVLGRISDVVWGPPLLILLFGTHLFLTVRLRFIQRYLGQAIRLSFRRTAEGKGDVSHFGALTTALAATIGTGNIVGVATAVTAGGPGAVLWMWLTGVFGIATKYAEALLSVKYRVTTSQGLMAGGPMYVLERGMKARWLGMLFAALTAVAAFGIGYMVQANSISAWSRRPSAISPWWTGGVMTVLTAVVILGGIKSIANVCEKLVPFMAVFYVLGCLILLAHERRRDPAHGLRSSSAPRSRARPRSAASWERGCARPSATASPAASSPTSRAWAARPSWPPPPDQEPGPAGPRVLDGDVLGHRGGVRHDGPGRRAVRGVGEGPQRRGPHQDRLRATCRWWGRSCSRWAC